MYPQNRPLRLVSVLSSLLLRLLVRLSLGLSFFLLSLLLSLLFGHLISGFSHHHALPARGLNLTHPHRHSFNGSGVRLHQSEVDEAHALAAVAGVLQFVVGEASRK